MSRTICEDDTYKREMFTFLGSDARVWVMVFKEHSQHSVKTVLWIENLLCYGRRTYSAPYRRIWRRKEVWPNTLEILLFHNASHFPDFWTRGLLPHTRVWTAWKQRLIFYTEITRAIVLFIFFFFLFTPRACILQVDTILVNYL